MRLPVAITLCLILMGSAALADDVFLINGLKYQRCQVVDVQGGQIVFLAMGSARVSKPLSEVASVTLAGQAEYNQAESLLAAKDLDQAGKVFAGLAGKSTDKRVQALAQWRTTQISQGVFAQEAAAVTLETAAAPASEAGEAPPAAAVNEKLANAAAMLAAGKPEDALRAIRGDLRSLPEEDLPAAFLLAGKAGMAAAPRAAADSGSTSQSLLAAGLDLMRVVAHWPASPQAGEALLLAGEVNARIGNPRSARLAYEQVVKRHPESQWAAEAKKRLDQLGD